MHMATSSSVMLSRYGTGDVGRGGSRAAIAARTARPATALCRVGLLPGRSYWSSIHLFEELHLLHFVLCAYEATWHSLKVALQFNFRHCPCCICTTGFNLCLPAAGFIVLQGLIMLEAGTNRVVLLTNHVSSSSAIQPNTPLTYTNDLDIASDGIIYFTDSVDVSPHRNAQHSNSVKHIVSIKGLPGYYDTVKGWAVGMLQVG